MDACHILLGRPWQFDRSVVHDSRKNTFTLSIKGKRIVLAPMREKVETEAEGGKNLLSLSQFIGKIRKERVVYALMPSSTVRDEEDVDDSPKELQVVLAKFVDLMPKKLPQCYLPGERYNIRLI